MNVGSAVGNGVVVVGSIVGMNVGSNVGLHVKVLGSTSQHTLPNKLEVVTSHSDATLFERAWTSLGTSSHNYAVRGVFVR